ncbi:hypothetical protein ACN263_08730 [Micromonospora sp. WMMD729]|uniref:hypothetical protein n=1 Tax=Micromonospora sp. WMMD729 TaxID=3404127 RepID=UPI003BF5F970
MNEDRLRQLLTDVAPDLAPPPDRIASVRRRAAHHRAWVAAGATVAVAAVSLIAAIPAFSSLGTTPAVSNDRPAGAVGPTTTSGATLRTDGCRTDSSGSATDPRTADAGTATDVAQRIAAYAEEHFADVYADSALQDSGPRVQVYRKPSPSFDSWIRAAFSKDCVEVRDVAHSAKELEEWSTRVSDDSAYWSRQGVTLNSVGTDPVNGVVRVGTNDVKKVRELLIDRYGNDAPLVAVEGGGLTW